MAIVLMYLQGQIQLQISSFSTSLTWYGSDSLSNSLIYGVENVAGVTVKAGSAQTIDVYLGDQQSIAYNLSKNKKYKKIGVVIQGNQGLPGGAVGKGDNFQRHRPALATLGWAEDDEQHYKSPSEFGRLWDKQYQWGSGGSTIKWGYHTAEEDIISNWLTTVILSQKRTIFQYRKQQVEPEWAKISGKWMLQNFGRDGVIERDNSLLKGQGKQKERVDFYKNDGKNNKQDMYYWALVQDDCPLSVQDYNLKRYDIKRKLKQDLVFVQGPNRQFKNSQRYGGDCSEKNHNKFLSTVCWTQDQNSKNDWHYFKNQIKETLAQAFDQMILKGHDVQIATLVSAGLYQGSDFKRKLTKNNLQEYLKLVKEVLLEKPREQAQTKIKQPTRVLRKDFFKKVVFADFKQQNAKDKVDRAIKL